MMRLFHPSAKLLLHTLLLVIMVSPAFGADIPVKRDFTPGYKEIDQLMRSQKSPPKNIVESVRPGMYPLPTDRDPVDVISRRTETLLSELPSGGRSTDLARFKKELASLQKEVEAQRKAGEKPNQEEYAAFSELYWQISRANPLINFDNILFIKHYPSRRGHMCDQYLGHNAKAGGGMYVLASAFSDEPELIDVLANSVVENGRLKGKRLIGGSFLSPDLSYDGKQIVFAYCECGEKQNKNRPGWNLESCYHLFKVNFDGTHLVQLTDGLYNDFDPCWLPNGRICFVSERRGGYGRCHGSRDAPSYTLTSINPDGEDLVYLSYHEANEWQPSVTGDGQIIYTRWDYVDRGTNQAHHPWITSIDGRDARSIHGNYPESRKGLHSRPWMEMDIRSIPGSSKFVATAAAHHGQAYGSLVVLDTNIVDDGAMSQLKRLTPEVGFPEAERGGGDFATAWPLSENHYLCTSRGGIYLIDAYGGRQLLYKSNDVPALSPIPLKARPRPPQTTHLTSTGLPVAKQHGVMSTGKEPGTRATISLVDVYDARMPWPEGTKITGLRVIQLISKATPRAPYSGTGRTNIREVLGTVPVEEDGSAHFYAPTNIGFYFQALDERGMAVQSMRSLTYAHPGERLVCQGCHEQRNHPPRNVIPKAMTRSPSEIKPDVSGSNPFNFKVLAQDVFDHKCNTCHKEKKGPKLDRKTAMRYVPYYISPKPYEPSRTVPGQFGALGSKLLKYLDKSHYGVNLTKEEFHRITLWMDTNSADLGAEQLNEDERSRLIEFLSTDEK